MVHNNNTVSFLDEVWGIDRVFNDGLALRAPVGPTNTVPKIKMNLVEHSDRYVITADIPGVAKENVTAKFDNIRDTVTVTTTTSTESSHDTGKVHLSERFYGTSSRTIRLHRGSADYDTVTACHADGVLTITINKLSDEQRKVNTGVINIE